MHQDTGNTEPPNVTREVRGLEGRVEILRDAHGIAHVRAGSSSDAWFGLGYVHASDRLWQMDAARRRMAGRWAEWVGADGIAADRLARRMGGESASRRDLAALGAPARAMLAAYSAGVNALLGEGRALPLEYRLLDTAPQPWEDWHSIAVLRHRGFLMGSVWFKLWRAAAVRAIGADAVTALRYHDGGADRLCIPPGADAKRWIATLADLGPAIEALAELGAADATGGGSNNWAIAGSRTASGRPLLAGDPHRVFERPGMYQQAQLAGDRFDVIGLTVPGVPGLPYFAHNGKVAWSVTHAFADIHDLFVERFSDGGRRHQTRSGWIDSEVRDEIIHVRDAAPVALQIVSTGHGPVVVGDPASGCALTLQSVQFALTDHSFDCLPAMLEADSVDALFATTRGFGLFDHNLLAADTAGHIGHRVRAIVPQRPRVNGWLPVPGWSGDHDWQGVIPWEAMPQTLDPARGFLVTANNRFVDEGPRERYYFSTDCHPPWRARRIEQRLAALPAATNADMATLLMDDVSSAAPLFCERLAGLNPQQLNGLSEGARQMLATIIGWDGHMAADSVAAAAYTRWRWALAALLHTRSGLSATAGDALLQLPPRTVATNQLWWTLPSLVLADDRRLLAGIDWPTAFVKALEQAASQRDDRAWGEMHQVRMSHPLAATFPDQAQLLQPPGAAVGGDNDTVCANGALAGNRPSTQRLQAVYGPIARYVFDVGDWEASRWIVFDGASGDPHSPHYLDQHALWAAGRMVPMQRDWSAIAEGARRTVLIAAPGNRAA